jgi:hypothetical protein
MGFGQKWIVYISGSKTGRRIGTKLRTKMGENLQEL